jgi:hypothetical protein
MLEVGVHRAANLVPMKIAKDGMSGSTDANRLQGRNAELGKSAGL